MPCNSQRNRQQDKYTAWENAHADQLGTGIAVLSAEAAVAGACPFFWTGLGTAACATALAALGAAIAAHSAAVYKTINAKNAYELAFQEWQDCLAKCKR